MLSYSIRRATAPLLIVALIAACGGDKNDQAARDIQLAPQDSGKPVADTAVANAPAPAPPPAAQPETKTPAKTPAKTPTAPAPAPAARTGMVAAGTSFDTHNAARMCTNNFKQGATFTVTTAGEIAGSNGVRIPAGSTVNMVVTESAISKNSKDQWKFAFDVVSVIVDGKTYEVEGDVTKVATIEAVRSQSTGQQAGKVATGAAVGAVAGQLLGKNTKSTVIGAAVGAAAGGAVAAGTADYEGCLPANGTITIAISKALTLPRA